MYTPNFNYVRVKSLKEAIQHLSSKGSRVHAGGTDLLGCLHDGIFEAKKIVSLSQLNDLKGIRETKDGGLRIGSLTTLTEIADHKVVKERYPALAKGASEAASPAAPESGHDRRQPLSETEVLVLSGRFSLSQKGRQPMLRLQGREPLSLSLR